MIETAKKEERKQIKIGTHGRSSGGFKNQIRTETVEFVPPKETLKARDAVAWKARKLQKQEGKTANRNLAKKRGHRMGNWNSGIARCKHPGCEATILMEGRMGSQGGPAATETDCTGKGA